MRLSLQSYLLFGTPVLIEILVRVPERLFDGKIELFSLQDLLSCANQCTKGLVWHGLRRLHCCNFEWSESEKRCKLHHDCLTLNSQNRDFFTCRKAGDWRSPWSFNKLFIIQSREGGGGEFNDHQMIFCGGLCHLFFCATLELCNLVLFLDFPRPWLSARIQASWWQHQGKGIQEIRQRGTPKVSKYYTLRFEKNIPNKGACFWSLQTWPKSVVTTISFGLKSVCPFNI